MHPNYAPTDREAEIALWNRCSPTIQSRPISPLPVSRARLGDSASRPQERARAVDAQPFIHRENPALSSLIRPYPTNSGRRNGRTTQAPGRFGGLAKDFQPPYDRDGYYRKGNRQRLAPTEEIPLTPTKSHQPKSNFRRPNDALHPLCMNVDSAWFSMLGTEPPRWLH